jgi:serine/threonine protein kinase
MTGDTVGIALEYAPHGDFYDVMGKINDPEKGVTPENTRMMRLAMLHDVAQGLGHMQSRKGGDGILHLDFGSRNMFIGEGGVSKIGDFGLSTKTSKFDIETTEKAKNAYMIAPEVTNRLSENLQTRTPVISSRSEGYQLTLGQVRKQFGELSESKQKILCGNVRDNISFEMTRDRQFDAKKAEVWSLGVIAFEMMTGRLPVPEQEGRDVTTETENRYRDFGSDFSKRALNSYDENGELVPGYFGTTTGDEVVDDLINQLMHPDPSQRPSPDQLLNHPAFQSENFNSELGHQLVEQLMSN